MMILQSKPHEFTSNYISWPQPNPLLCCESFDQVYKVTVPEAGEVALRVMKIYIAQQIKFEILRKEIEIYRYQLCNFYSI